MLANPKPDDSIFIKFTNCTTAFANSNRVNRKAVVNSLEAQTWMPWIQHKLSVYLLRLLLDTLQQLVKLLAEF